MISRNHMYRQRCIADNTVTPPSMVRFAMVKFSSEEATSLSESALLRLVMTTAQRAVSAITLSTVSTM